GLERLRSRELDALVGRWDFLPHDIHAVSLGSEELTLALPDLHPLAKQEPVSFEALADEKWVVLPGAAGASLANRLHKLASRCSFDPHVVHVAPDSSTQLLMVEAGLGIALTFSGVRKSV